MIQLVDDVSVSYEQSFPEGMVLKSHSDGQDIAHFLGKEHKEAHHSDFIGLFKTKLWL